MAPLGLNFRLASGEQCSKSSSTKKLQGGACSAAVHRGSKGTNDAEERERNRMASINSQKQWVWHEMVQLGRVTASTFILGVFKRILEDLAEKESIPFWGWQTLRVRGYEPGVDEWRERTVVDVGDEDYRTCVKRGGRSEGRDENRRAKKL